MGAESSTAQSVEDLGNALTQIEKKLELLEDNNLLQNSSAVSR